MNILDKEIEYYGDDGKLYSATLKDHLILFFGIILTVGVLVATAIYLTTL